jgi:hypothetical protein
MKTAIHNTKHQDEDRRCNIVPHSPFTKWRPVASPVDDLTWLAFGFDLEHHMYKGTPPVYSYHVADDNMIANAKRLLKIFDGIPDIPDYAKHAVEVARATLRCLVDRTFPACGLIAHHIMVGGDFMEQDSWAVPLFINPTRPYAQPGLDLIAGVQQLLTSMDAVSPSGRLPPLPVNAISA